MRAYCYFSGVRIWGGLPVRLTPYIDLKEDPKKTRTPANEILSNIIIPDLDQAYTLVDKAITGPAWNINVGPILAIKTDVLMWMKDYQGVLNTSQMLIDLKRYALETSTLPIPSQRRAAII